MVSIRSHLRPTHQYRSGSCWRHRRTFGSHHRHRSNHVHCRPRSIARDRAKFRPNPTRVASNPRRSTTWRSVRYRAPHFRPHPMHSRKDHPRRGCPHPSARSSEQNHPYPRRVHSIDSRSRRRQISYRRRCQLEQSPLPPPTCRRTNVPVNTPDHSVRRQVCPPCCR